MFLLYSWLYYSMQDLCRLAALRDFRNKVSIRHLQERCQIGIKILETQNPFNHKGNLKLLPF